MAVSRVQIGTEYKHFEFSLTLRTTKMLIFANKSAFWDIGFLLFLLFDVAAISKGFSSSNYFLLDFTTCMSDEYIFSKLQRVISLALAEIYIS